MTVNHPQFGTMCAICFKGLTWKTCAEDVDGVKWDLCPGACAREAGLVEKSAVVPVEPLDLPRPAEPSA